MTKVEKIRLRGMDGIKKHHPKRDLVTRIKETRVKRIKDYWAVDIGIYRLRIYDKGSASCVPQPPRGERAALFELAKEEIRKASS